MPTQNEIFARLFPNDRRPHTPKAMPVTSAPGNGTVLDGHAPEVLDIMEASGLYVVQSAKYAARLTFDRLIDQRGGVSAEVTVVLGSTEILSGVDIGLKSDTGHTKLAASLRALAPTEP